MWIVDSKSFQPSCLITIKEHQRLVIHRREIGVLKYHQKKPPQHSDTKERGRGHYPTIWRPVRFFSQFFSSHVLLTTVEAHPSPSYSTQATLRGILLLAKDLCFTFFRVSGSKGWFRRWMFATHLRIFCHDQSICPSTCVGKMELCYLFLYKGIIPAWTHGWTNGRSVMAYSETPPGTKFYNDLSNSFFSGSKILVLWVFQHFGFALFQAPHEPTWNSDRKDRIFFGCSKNRFQRRFQWFLNMSWVPFQNNLL